MDRKEQEKKDRLLGSLDKGMVMIHLDARRAGVLVPADLKGEPHLRLNLSYKFDPPDLSVNDWGVRSTLSFKGSRFTVAVPWSALFAITGQAAEEFWLCPDDMPPELVEQAMLAAKAPVPGPAEESKPKAMLREVVLDGARRENAKEEPPKPAGRGHLRVVK